MRNKRLILVYTWLILFGLLPIFLIVLTSFLSRTTTHFAALPFTLTHYQNLLSPLFLNVFLKSLKIGFITTILCLLIAYPMSYFMVKSKYQSRLLLLIIIPFWTSSLVRTYALIAILKVNGVLNLILQHQHLIEAPLSLLYSNTAVIIGLVYTLFPFMVLPLYTQMERFDFRLLDAGRDLGANHLRLFFHVFLPNTKQGIVAGATLVFLPAMTLFYIPNILGGARSTLLGNLIQNQFFVAENWPQGSATSVLLTVILVALFMLFRRSSEFV